MLIPTCFIIAPARGLDSTGLSYECFLKKHFSLGANIIYSQRGFTIPFLGRDFNGNLIERSIKVNYDYLSVPIKAGFTIGKNIYGFANIGVIPAFLVNGKMIVPYASGTSWTGTATIDVTSHVSKFDLAGLIEGGGGYKFNRYWLFTEVTYQQSITKTADSRYYWLGKMKHHGLTLSFGLKYRLTKE